MFADEIVGLIDSGAIRSGIVVEMQEADVSPKLGWEQIVVGGFAAEDDFGAMRFRPARDARGGKFVRQINRNFAISLLGLFEQERGSERALGSSIFVMCNGE